VTSEVLDEFLNEALGAAPDSFEAVFEIDRHSRLRTIEKLRLAA
jgi:hypothetical protein